MLAYIRPTSVNCFETNYSPITPHLPSPTQLSLIPAQTTSNDRQADLQAPVTTIQRSPSDQVVLYIGNSQSCSQDQQCKDQDPKKKHKTLENIGSRIDMQSHAGNGRSLR